jgi:O-antigen/teichoic acid export membrane protein
MKTGRANGHARDRIHVRNSAADRETRLIQADEAHRLQQEAGLAALMGIAMQVSLGLSEAPTMIIPNISSLLSDESSPDLDDSKEWRTDTDAAQGRLRPLLLTRLGTDHLVRNSLYLMLTSGLQAALGFTFWIIMARLFSTAEVGRASSLISATGLIAYLALFGLSTTLVRFLPTTRDKNSLITGAFILVPAIGAVIGLAYIFLTPVLAPRLEFVMRSPVLTAGFALLAGAAALNLLTDSVFIASRKAGFCALTDGAVGGLSRIVFGLIFAGTGAYGLYCASAGGFAAAALVSVLLVVTTFHWRPSIKNSFQTLKPLLRFTGANYIAHALNLVPTVVVPLVVLDRLGAQAAAYYFVAFQMATFLYSAVYAVEQSFLAEGSQAGADWRAIRKRSRRLAIMLFVPGGGILVLAAHWMLLTFGPGYSQHGTTTLELLGLAVIPIAACNWSWTVLQLSGRIVSLVVSMAVYSSAVCGFAWILAPHGLASLTAAWPVGTTLAAITATAFPALRPRKASGRHRKDNVTSRAQTQPSLSSRRRPLARGTASDGYQ